MSETLGQRLQRLRNAAGLTQSQMAQMCGLGAPQAISHWEIDRSVPRTLMIPRVAKILGVTSDYLLSGETGREM